jgi:hypothetical protein|tara:strand:- start:3786 stop:4190 length:405 start_codon:yes stop_codon:yes gene_type:complete
MDFRENDIVVIKGKKYDANKEEIIADIYKILFVGINELIVVSRKSYGKVPFKIQKSECISLRTNYEEAYPSVTTDIKLGSLVLGIDTKYDGTINKTTVGHVIQIIENHNSMRYYVVNSDNKDTMFEKDKILLLQ